jgi:hypothetical protein
VRAELAEFVRDGCMASIEVAVQIGWHGWIALAGTLLLRAF